MNKKIIRHIITSTLLMFSVGLIIVVIFFGKSIFPTTSIEPDESQAQINTSPNEQSPEDQVQVPENYVPPFTMEDFLLQDRRDGRQYLGMLNRRELPKLMGEYMYIPGLPVTLYESKDLDDSAALEFPGDGVFFIENSYSRGDGWIYQVLISEGGYQRSMFVEEEKLAYAEFYGQGPSQYVRKEYEAKQAQMHEIKINYEKEVNDAYKSAVAEYYAASYVEPKSSGIFKFSEMKNFDLSQERTVFGGILAVFVFFIIFIVGSIFFAWRRSRQRDSELLTLDEITEIEQDFSPEAEQGQDPKKPDYYSPFSERGADYYEGKEDTNNLAGKRF